MVNGIPSYGNLCKRTRETCERNPPQFLCHLLPFTTSKGMFFSIQLLDVLFPLRNTEFQGLFSPTKVKPRVGLRVRGLFGDSKTIYTYIVLGWFENQDGNFLEHLNLESCS